MATLRRRFAVVLGCCAALTTFGMMVPSSFGGPINSDAAFTPRVGGGILRLQYAFEEADGRDAVRHISKSTAKAVFVYGMKPNLALFLNVPYVNRQVDRFDRRFGRSEDAHDGIGDVTVMAKYRFFQNDVGPLETTRAAVLGGLNIRSGDSDFSSDSYDPIVGAVYSWRKDRAKFDADVLYQVNTGGGERRHDVLRYDLALSRRVYPAAYGEDHTYEIDAVAEINGRYVADGTHEVFISPGVALAWERMSFEVSVQIPAVQELPGGPEVDYRIVAGLRFRW